MPQQRKGGGLALPDDSHFLPQGLGFHPLVSGGHPLKRKAVHRNTVSKEYRREDGSVGVSYNVKKVFDISQTNAQRPAPKTLPDDRSLLKALIHEPPCKVEVRDEVPDGRNVVYLPEEKTILVRRGLGWKGQRLLV